MILLIEKSKAGDPMSARHFPIFIETDEDGVYIVSCPLFKACRSYGETIEEAMDNIKEVIEMCLEEERESGSFAGNRFVGVRDLELVEHA